MSDNNRKDYRRLINEKGKEAFTIEQMIEYGFWPKDLPLPSQQQADESDEAYAKRKAQDESIEDLRKALIKKQKASNVVQHKVSELNKILYKSYDYNEVRKNIHRQMLNESVMRRQLTKEASKKVLDEKKKEWELYKKTHILTVGKGYSYAMNDLETNELRLEQLGLPIIKNEQELATFLEVELATLKFLTYHRDVVLQDHYHRYQVEKKKGGHREIAAPKKTMKNAQKKILDQILNCIPIKDTAHGFVKEKSIVTGAKAHGLKPDHIINMDLKDYFGTVAYHRVVGMFKSFGYCGKVSSLLAMICTYCKRASIEIKGELKWVRVGERVLPQGAPTSPMITNILCYKMDDQLEGLAKRFGYCYTRYADDMCFSTVKSSAQQNNIRPIIKFTQRIVSSEGFVINEKKTRVLYGSQCQSITGIVINDEIGVRKRWVKNVRAMIHQLNKCVENKKAVPIEKQHELKGCLTFLKSVNEERYKKIINDGYECLNIIKSID